VLFVSSGMPVSFHSRSFWRDRHFQMAVAAGPLVWLLIGLWGLAPAGNGGGLDARSLLLVGLVYPWLEEMAFRGALQGGLSRWRALRRGCGGITVANFITSGVFVAAHLFAYTVPWALAVFFPSLVFGYFRDRYHSILPSAVLHMFYNTGLLVLVSN